MMTKKLISAVAVAGVLAASVSTAAQASEHIRHRNTAIAAGVLGAALIGSAIASNNNAAPQTYYAPQQNYYQPQGVYGAQPYYPSTTVVQAAAPAYYPSVQYVQPATEVIYVDGHRHHRRAYRDHYRGDRYYDRGDRYYGR